MAAESGISEEARQEAIDALMAVPKLREEVAFLRRSRDEWRAECLKLRARVQELEVAAEG